MATYTGILSLVLQGLKIGVQAVKAIPAPAPAGVAAYLIESEKQINNISKSVNIITITAASFGIFFLRDYESRKTMVTPKMLVTNIINIITIQSINRILEDLA